VDFYSPNGWRKNRMNQKKKRNWRRDSMRPSREKKTQNDDLLQHIAIAKAKEQQKREFQFSWYFVRRSPRCSFVGNIARIFFAKRCATWLKLWEIVDLFFASETLATRSLFFHLIFLICYVYSIPFLHR
jgi:hypothetical protein